MRVLVCGSRTWSDKDAMEHFLFSWLDYTTVLIHGNANGADSMAASLARRYVEDGERPHVMAFPADWNKHGKAAGPIRNQQMLYEGRPDLVIAFVDKPLAESRGTNDMVTRAKAAGLPVYVVEKIQ